MKVVISQKVDLDTCLTALILGVARRDEVLVVRGEASPEDLSDSKVICIEVGGSGQGKLNNYDHHNTGKEFAPACKQGFGLYRNRFNDKGLLRLVEYVSMVDTDPTSLPRTEFPNLSNVFSGMLFVVENPVERFFKGIEILSEVLKLRIDPFGQMPQLPEWRDYIEAKRVNTEALARVKSGAQIFETKGGLRAGFVETDVIGAPKVLYQMGCEIAIVFSPAFGDPPVPKYTISGKGMKVSPLLPTLNELDPGWGGPATGTIIGSPKEGSALSTVKVIQTVKENM